MSRDRRSTRLARLAPFAGAGLWLLVPTQVHAQTIQTVQTAAPTVLVVVLSSGPHRGSYTNPVDVTPSKWSVDSQPLTASRIHLYSMPSDEDRQDPTEPYDYPITMSHRVYLELPNNLAEGHTYAISTPHGSVSFTFRAREAFCESIKVNQAGYNALATSRFANYGVFMGDGGTMSFSSLPSYSVIDETTNRTVSSGTAQDMGADTSTDVVTSGEHVYRLPLAAVPSGGPYFVAVDGCGRSYSFGVGDKYSRQIAYVHTRGLYHQRCGIALQSAFTPYTRAICHAKVGDTRTLWDPGGNITVPDNMPMQDMRGGYHDAGDFDRRPWHAIVPMLMLSYYEAFPTHFRDGQFDIPESANGVPDFLDEAMWGVLGWENLQVNTASDAEYGGVRMGTETYRDARGYGVDSAASDPLKYGTWGVGDETGAESKAVTALGAGMFAQASRLIKPYDAAHSAALLQRAQDAWTYLEGHTDVNQPYCRFMYAALQLYLATGTQSYHDIFKKAMDAIIPPSGGFGTYPNVYQPGNNDTLCQTGHFSSYLLTNLPTDAALKTRLQNTILGFAETGDFIPQPPENTPYPIGARVPGYLEAGAATAQGRYADVFAFAWLLTNDPTKKQAYFNAVSQYADYALGLNPLGRSFVTGLGAAPPQSPLHLDSYYTKYGASDGVTHDHQGNPIGNVPGIVIYGPTHGRSGMDYQTVVSDKLYPAWDGLPDERRWGDAWSLVNSNEFTVWQTQIWNIVMHGFLYDASRDSAPASDASAPDAAGSGGASSGGHSAGGADSGASHSGGANSGGHSAGGADSGANHSGGANSGGNHSGGAASGANHSGGADSGGSDSGRADSGANDSGGAGAGGNHSGGAASGGRDSGRADSGRADSATGSAAAANVTTQDEDGSASCGLGNPRRGFGTRGWLAGFGIVAVTTSLRRRHARRQRELDPSLRGRP